MLYVNQYTGKKYDTIAECEASEKEYEAEVARKKEEAEKKKAEKKTRADEVSSAFKAYKEAEKTYIELRNEFIKDYGYYHMTYSDSEDTSEFSFKDLVDELFNIKKIF